VKKVSLVLVFLFGIGVIATAGVTEITFWRSLTGSHGEVLVSIVEEFNEMHPDIHVEEVYQGSYGDLERQMLSSLAAGSPPTIAMMYENFTVQVLPALAPLGEYLSEDVIDNITEPMIVANTYDGKLITAPFNKSIIVLIYRADLIDEPPTTWDEFIDLAAEMTVGDPTTGDFEMTGTAWRPSNPEMWLTILEQAGGELLAEDGQVGFQTEEGLASVEFFEALMPYASVETGFLSGLMGEGAIAFFLDTSAGYPFNVAAAERAEGEIGVALPPMGPDNNRSMIQGTNLGVFGLGHTEEQVEAAAKFIEYLLSDEVMIRWGIETGYLPCTYSSLYSEEWQTYIEDNPHRATMTEAFIDGFSQAHHENYSDMRSLMIDFFELLLRGDLKPQEALDWLESEFEPLL